MRGVAAALLALTLGTPAAQAPLPPRPTAGPGDIAGAWVLNRDLTTVPQRGDMEREGGERRGGGGGGYGGPGGGRGGFGGMGRGGGTGRPSEEDMRKMQVIRRQLTEIPERLIVVRDAQSVSITDGNGRHLSYKVDGKKQDQFTGDGEFTTKSHFEGNRLFVEEDFSGHKLVVTYTPVLDGDKARLEVTVKPAGGENAGGRRGGPNGMTDPSAPPREFKRVYDLEARAQPGYFFF